MLIILLIIKVLEVYLWLIIASVLASWLVAFDVLNLRNKWVYKAYGLLNRAVEPPMAYLRRYVPPIGGIDFTPMVMIFGIYIIQGFLISLLAR
jgi:YggT family protein